MTAAGGGGAYSNQTPPTSGSAGNVSSPQWKVVQLPLSYLVLNWPIKVCVWMCTLYVVSQSWSYIFDLSLFLSLSLSLYYLSFFLSPPPPPPPSSMLPWTVQPPTLLWLARPALLSTLALRENGSYLVTRSRNRGLPVEGGWPGTKTSLSFPVVSKREMKR